MSTTVRVAIGILVIVIIVVVVVVFGGGGDEGGGGGGSYPGNTMGWCRTKEGASVHTTLENCKAMGYDTFEPDGTSGVTLNPQTGQSAE